MRDIVRLYLNPPDRALVLCVDKKSQIQALDRSQRCCLCAPARLSGVLTTMCATATTNLFAALDFKAGTVIGELHHRHRAIEFRKFLETLDHQVPHRFVLHLMTDNYATHKTPAIKR